MSHTKAKFNFISECSELDEFMDAMAEEQVAGIICVYLDTDGNIKQACQGPMGTMHQMASVAKAIGESLLSIADHAPDPITNQFHNIN